MAEVETVSVFTSVPSVVRSSIFSAWIAGYSDKQTLANLTDRVQNEGDLQVQLSVIQSQYRFFDALEAYLCRPKYFLKEHTYFPMAQSLKLSLVEQYYSIDESVIRELIGKKIVGKTRRDLDDISIKSFIPLVSCRRQFDNLRSIMRRAEESPDYLYQLVRKKFLLSESLCRSYAAVIFLNYHQIRVNDHPVLEDTPLDVALECAHIFISSWTVNGASLSINPRIPHVMRDLQSLWGSIDPQVFAPIVRGLEGGSSEDTAVLHAIMLKGLQIGAGLLQSRRLQNLLIDITDDVALSLQSNLNLPSSLFAGFFAQIIETLKSHLPSFFKADSDVGCLVAQYFAGLSRCSAVIIADSEPRQ